MKGGEYLTPAVLGELCARMAAAVREELSAWSGSVEAFLRAALVSGTSIYDVDVTVDGLPPKRWRQLAAECTRQIDSLVDLLRGLLPAPVMELVTRKSGGLFPAPTEISFKCSCPDWAGMCKHVAAVLYGVGVRLEEQPELLFHLRGVDHTDLVGGAAAAVPRLAEGAKRGRKVMKGADFSALFGIELDSSPAAAPSGRKSARDPSGGAQGKPGKRQRR